MDRSANEDQVALLQTRKRTTVVQPGVGQESEMCVEYIVVQRDGASVGARPLGERFIGLMDQHLADWHHRRDELNAARLAAEDWTTTHRSDRPRCGGRPGRERSGARDRRDLVTDAAKSFPHALGAVNSGLSRFRPRGAATCG